MAARRLADSIAGLPAIEMDPIMTVLARWIMERAKKKAAFSIVAVLAALSLLSGCGEDLDRIPYDPDFVRLVQSGQVEAAKAVRQPGGVVLIRSRGGPGSSVGEFEVEVEPGEPWMQLFDDHSVTYSLAPAPPKPDPWVTIYKMLPIFVAAFNVVVVVVVLVLAARFVKAVERIAERDEK
jgi:hypothetical protein